MCAFAISTWADLSEDCPQRFTVTGSNHATFVFGEGKCAGELVFDHSAIHALVMLGTEAVAEMDAQYEREEAERIAREHRSA